jgi:hypothetical protein
MKRKAFVLQLILISATLLGLSLPVSAQPDAGWSEAVQLSSDNTSSWFSDIAVAPNGDVFVVWGGGEDIRPPQKVGFDLLIYTRLHDGVWSEPNDIVAPGTGGFVPRASLALGRNGQFYLLVRSELKQEFMVAPWRESGKASAWSTPDRINGGSNTTYYNALAIDGQDTLHALWTENVPPEAGFVEPPHSDDPEALPEFCISSTELFYRSSNDNGQLWSSPVNLSQMPFGSDKPHIAIDAFDRVHVVWDEGNDREVRCPPRWGGYRRLDSAGQWGETIRFQLPAGDAVQLTTLGLVGGGNPVVVYRSSATEAVYYQYSNNGGSSFSDPALVPGIRARDINDSPFDGYTMVSDGAGNVHFFMVGYLINDNGIPPRLLHLVFDGENWSSPEIVSSNNLFPEWPRAAVSNGNQLHVTWFTRSATDRFQSEKARYKIWYSTKILADVPQATALPFYTPTPTPTPTPSATPTQLARRPTLDPSLMGHGGPVAQPKLDTNATQVLLITAMPIALVTLALWFVRRVRR